MAGLGHVPFVWKLTREDQQLLKERGFSIPKNVHVVEFAPQNDLLGHPAVRGFVTQGGTNSVLEVHLAKTCLTKPDSRLL